MIKIKKIFKILLIFIILAAITACKADTNITEPTELPAQIPETPNYKYTVCIDPGHGFGDGGCESEFMLSNEAEVNLNMALVLKNKLEACGVNVLLTHNGHNFPTCKEISKVLNTNGIEYDTSRFIENNVFSAYERVMYANALNCETPLDLFISLHINSIENHSEVNRYELYYYQNNLFSESLSTLCNKLKLNFDNDTEIIKTSSEESYTVTRYTDYPSLLIECGYATNKAQAEKINSQAWRDNFCTGIADEIISWLENM